MIVRDEAVHLARCLESARPAVQELVVVDTGSTDETRAIATSYGARVFDFAWCDDFAAARNESIRHATCPWILWMDGDDELDARNLERLRHLVTTLGGELSGYLMQTASVSPSGLLQGSHPLVRLFPNDPRVRWERRVHEQVVPSLKKHGGDLRKTNVVIRHHGYSTRGALLAKAERNLYLAELECDADPLDAYAQFCRGCSLANLGRHAEALIALNLAVGGVLPDLAVRRAYATMARSYAGEGSITLALEALEAGLRSHPDDLDLLFTEAQLRGATGDYARAEQCMRLVLGTRIAEEVDCTDAAVAGPRGRYMLALLCALQGNHVDAEQEARESIAADPTYASAWLVLAEALAGQQRLGQVEGLVSDPSIPMAAKVQLRMYLHAARHDLEGASRELETVVDIHLPGMGRAREWLAAVAAGATPRPIRFVLSGARSAPLGARLPGLQLGLSSS